MSNQTGCVPGNSIITSSGIYFDLEQPDGDDVSLLDIAYSLAKECRYTGQIGHNKKHYSVAEHCVRCVDYAFNELGIRDRQALLSILLHDASEAYTGDINKPLKNLIKSKTDVLEDIERRIDEAVAVAFGCDFIKFHDQIKQADMFMLFTEQKYFFGSTKRKWIGQDEFVPVDGYDPRCLKPKQAATAFLATFESIASPSHNSISVR